MEPVTAKPFVPAIGDLTEGLRLLHRRATDLDGGIYLESGHVSKVDRTPRTSYHGRTKTVMPHEQATVEFDRGGSTTITAASEPDDNRDSPRRSWYLPCAPDDPQAVQALLHTRVGTAVTVTVLVDDLDGEQAIARVTDAVAGIAADPDLQPRARAAYDIADHHLTFEGKVIFADRPHWKPSLGSLSKVVPSVVDVHEAIRLVTAENIRREMVFDTRQQRSQAAKRAAHSRRGGRQLKLTNEQADEMLTALADGKSAAELADRYGISVPTVYNYLRRSQQNSPR